MISMAWNTPLADPLAGLSLSAVVLVGLASAAIVAALPAAIAIRAHCHRAARRLGQIEATPVADIGRNEFVWSYVDTETGATVTGFQLTERTAGMAVGWLISHGATGAWVESNPTRIVLSIGGDSVPLGTWFVRIEIDGRPYLIRVPEARFVRQFRPVQDGVACWQGPEATPA